MKRVMVFGVFDGVHEGHRALFRQAKEHGDRLIVAVAQDAVVKGLKGSAPAHSLEERMALVQAEPIVDEAIPGDEALGTYGVIKAHAPDVVVLGYDQRTLAADLFIKRAALGLSCDVFIATAHEPDKYHNSILNDRDPR